MKALIPFPSKSAVSVETNALKESTFWWLHPIFPPLAIPIGAFQTWQRVVFVGPGQYHAYMEPGATDEDWDYLDDKVLRKGRYTPENWHGWNLN